MPGKRFTNFRFIIIFAVIVAGFLTLMVAHRHRITDQLSKICNNQPYVLRQDNSEQLLKLMRHIIRAHRYSRSGKAIYELTEAYKMVQKFIVESNNETIRETLNLMNNELFSMTAVYSNNTNEQEICPEVYMGMKYGYPFYYTGYKTDNNSCIGKPLGSLVTVLLNLVDDITIENLQSVLKGFSEYYPSIKIIIGHSTDKNFNLTGNHNILLINTTAKTSGNVWKQLAQQATSKYVIVGRHLVQIDNHTSIERLLRFLSYQIADVVGTSHRYVDGRWFRGCHTSALRNYTLKFVDGYDLSYNSCLYCDYLTGPFAIRREQFINILDTSLSGDTVFVDMLTKMSQESKIIFSCPDVMVTVEEKELHALSKSDWLPFIQKWQLNRMVFTNGEDLRFTCSESKLSCPWKGGLIMPICCIQELSDMMKFIVKTLTDNNIVVELEGGSNVNAAKIYGIAPYERDADFDWPVTDHEKFASLKSHFKENGYNLIEEKNSYECVGNMSIVNCGYFAVKNAHWRIEMWGANGMESDESIRVGFLNRTKIMIDGMWMISYHSPAAAARNQYGDDIYQHIEHWVTLGYKTGWVQPKTGNWLPCPKPGFHGCLDLYLPVGDIQFKDVWI